MTNPIRDHWLAHIKSAAARSEFPVVPALRCADGFSVSVQAGPGKYSRPRYLIEDGDFSAWEAGFPSEEEKLLMPYVEDAERPTDTVYGYVPTDVVNAVIEKHGGLATTPAA